MKQILYSHGEPAGIGIDLILRIAKLKFWSSINIPIVVISDGELLKARAKLLKLKIEFHELQDLKKTKKNETGCIQFHCVSQCKDFTPGVLNPQNASYVISNLNFAIDAAIENSKIAVVTGPIQKSNIVEGGLKTFQGHTEWIQKRTGSKDAVMLLASKKLSLIHI